MAVGVMEDMQVRALHGESVVSSQAMNGAQPSCSEIARFIIAVVI